MSASSRWASEPRDAADPTPLPVERTIADPEPVREREVVDRVVIEREPHTLADRERDEERIGGAVPSCRPARDRWADRWDADDLPSARVKRGEEERKPLDLDQLQEAAWAIVGAFLYLLGVIAAAVTLTMAFAGWVGALVVLVAGGVPSGYSLLKASQRRAQKAQWDHFDAQQERTDHAATAGFDIPAVR